MIPHPTRSQLDNASGSLSTGEPVFLAIGKLRRPHGLKGEILMDVLTSFPERLKPGVLVFVGKQHLPLNLRSCRGHKHAFLVAFEGYNDRERVGELRNQLVQVRADDRPPLPDGDYYHHQLLGLRVVTEAGKLLGVLSKIIETGANDVYLVLPQEGPEILLPAIDSVILNIDLEQGELRVQLIPGLIPDEST